MSASLLIADTTREQREQIVAESIGNISGLCDGCSPGIAEMYQDYIDGREASGESLVIRPPQSLQIGHTEKNPDELERVYQIGVREAEKRLDDIQSFLAGGET